MSFNRELFIKAGAVQMAETRPDIWTLGRAENTLNRWLSSLESFGAPSSCGSGGFTLLHHVTDPETGEKEFSLVQQVIDYTIFTDNEDSVFVWHAAGGDKIPQELVAASKM